MTGNFNPNLLKGSDTDLNCPDGILHVFSLTKLLPVGTFAEKCSNTFSLWFTLFGM